MLLGLTIQPIASVICSSLQKIRALHAAGACELWLLQPAEVGGHLSGNTLQPLLTICETDQV
jgi:hypothetical protein